MVGKKGQTVASTASTRSMSGPAQNASEGGGQLAGQVSGSIPANLTVALTRSTGPVRSCSVTEACSRGPARSESRTATTNEAAATALDTRPAPTINVQRGAADCATTGGTVQRSPGAARVKGEAS